MLFLHRFIENLYLWLLCERVNRLLWLIAVCLLRVLWRVCYTHIVPTLENGKRSLLKSLARFFGVAAFSWPFISIVLYNG